MWFLHRNADILCMHARCCRVALTRWKWVGHSTVESVSFWSRVLTMRRQCLSSCAARANLKHRLLVLWSVSVQVINPQLSLILYTAFPILPPPPKKSEPHTELTMNYIRICQGSTAVGIKYSVYDVVCDFYSGCILCFSCKLCYYVT